MSFLIKDFTGHAGFCVLNRAGTGINFAWQIQGGTFTPTINGYYVTLEGGFRYMVVWNWASSNTTTALRSTTFSVVRFTGGSSVTSNYLVSREVTSDVGGTYNVQTHEASVVFDAPCDCEIQMGASFYESTSSSLLIWRFPL
jgi:hypothetical protein